MNTITQHSDVGAPYGFNENFIQPGALLRGTCNSMYTSGKETVRPVPSTINVPSGWNRILDNEKIVYIRYASHFIFSTSQQLNRDQCLEVNQLTLQPFAVQNIELNLNEPINV